MLSTSNNSAHSKSDENEATNASPPENPKLWVDRYGDVLLRYCSSRVASIEIAEDLVQETFLAAYKHRSQFQGDSSFGTWLVAILRRKIVDFHRRRGKSPDLDAESLGPGGELFSANGKWASATTHWKSSPAKLAENAEFWQKVKECLGGLPLHLSQAFTAREFGSITDENVAGKFGITPQNYAVRLHRARLLLRQCLDRNWFRESRNKKT